MTICQCCCATPSPRDHRWDSSATSSSSTPAIIAGGSTSKPAAWCRSPRSAAGSPSSPATTADRRSLGCDAASRPACSRADETDTLVRAFEYIYGLILRPRDRGDPGRRRHRQPPGSHPTSSTRSPGGTCAKRSARSPKCRTDSTANGWHDCRDDPAGFPAASNPWPGPGARSNTSSSIWRPPD